MHAPARSESLVSCSEYGSGSCDSLNAESNAQAVQLVAQLAHVDARGVRAPRIDVRHRAHAMTGSGH